MRFYKIQEDKLINLDTIRTVQVLNKEIYITFTCGDTKSERVVFGLANNAEAAFKDLCSALMMKD